MKMQRRGSCLSVSVLSFLRRMTFLAEPTATPNKDNIFQSLLQLCVAMRLKTGQCYRATAEYLPRRWLGHARFHTFLHSAAWNGDGSTFDHENQSSTLKMASGGFQEVGLQTYTLISIFIKQCCQNPLETIFYASSISLDYTPRSGQKDITAF